MVLLELNYCGIFSKLKIRSERRRDSNLRLASIDRTQLGLSNYRSTRSEYDECLSYAQYKYPETYAQDRSHNIKHKIWRIGVHKVENYVIKCKRYYKTDP